jgi:RNA polymerase sigma-70 factor (ECF subfamily)
VSGCYVSTQPLLSAFLASVACLSDPMSEQDLVARAQGGDVTAFENLYRTHVGRVYALCLRMVADPTRAENLTQEAFIRAWQKLRSFRGRSAFATWLHRLTVNTVLGDMRSRGRRRDRDPIEEGLALVPDPRPQRDTAAKIDLEKAIARLPDQARMVFVLHDVEGYQHREIGRLLGIATGTSKAHLHRARRLLREVLES